MVLDIKKIEFVAPLVDKVWLVLTEAVRRWEAQFISEAIFWKDTPRNKAALAGLVPRLWPKD